MLDRLCIAVDGSDVARRAATVGIALAGAADASVDVVRVLSEPEREADGGQSWDGSRVLAGLEEDAPAAGVPIEGHVLDGTPAEAIVEFAADRDADLLVLGRSGRGGVGDRLLGSVVHAALREAEQPVLAVPEGDDGIELGEILVPTDGSDAAERAAPWAAELATQHDARIHACYVLDLAKEGGLFSAGGMTEAEIDRLEADRERHLDRLTALLRESDPDLSVESAVRRDEADAGIAESVEASDVDLVVMGSERATTAVGQLFGSVADRVQGRVDVPVLVVPAGRP